MVVSSPQEAAMPNLAVLHEVRKESKMRAEADRWCEQHYVVSQACPAGIWLMDTYCDVLDRKFEGEGEGFMAAYDDMQANIAKAGATEAVAAEGEED